MSRQFTDRELEHLTNYWCKTLGIHSQDLTRHHCIDDVILLIKFIDEYSQEFKAKHRVQIHIMWDLCYNKQKSLTNHQLKQLLGIGNKLEHIRSIKAASNNQSRQKIKALRRTIPE
jgi:hypothetical protein